MRNEGSVITTASGGGIAGASGAISSLHVTADVATTIGNAAELSGIAGLNVVSESTTNLTDIGNVEIAGGVSLQKAEAKESIRTGASKSIGAASKLRSLGGTVVVDSVNNVGVKSEAATRFYGLGSGSKATAETTISGLSGVKLAETTWDGQ
ncbi:MAG: hypothetical protein R3C05_19160 [Pirellulaceae bacterium]